MSNEEFIALIRKNVAVVACILLSLVLGGVIYFRSDVEPDLQKQLDSKQAEGDRITANIANSAQLKEQLAALSTSNHLIDSRLIQPEQLAQNLGYFYQLESDTGTKIIDVRQDGPVAPAKGAAKTHYVPIAYSVSVGGDYPAVMEFLRRLEYGSLFCRVTGCLVRPRTSDRSGPVIMSMDLQILGKS